MAYNHAPAHPNPYPNSAPTPSSASTSNYAQSQDPIPLLFLIRLPSFQPSVDTSDALASILRLKNTKS